MAETVTVASQLAFNSGGNSAAYFLRMVGKDSFVFTDSGCACQQTVNRGHELVDRTCLFLLSPGEIAGLVVGAVTLAIATLSPELIRVVAEGHHAVVADDHLRVRFAAELEVESQGNGVRLEPVLTVIGPDSMLTRIY